MSFSNMGGLGMGIRKLPDVFLFDFRSWNLMLIITDGLFSLAIDFISLYVFDICSCIQEY